MQYTIYQIAFLFFVFSFLGWVYEEIYAAFRYGRFVNRGFLNGPWCPQYGIIMLIALNDVKDLSESPVLQYIVVLVLFAVIQYISGVILKVITGKKFWDYSKSKWNVNGYISLGSAVAWATIIMLNIWLVYPFAYIVCEVIHNTVMLVILIALGVIFMVDVFFSVVTALKWKRMQGGIYENVVTSLEKTKSSIGLKVFGWIQGRMYKAFPELTWQEKNEKVGFGKTKNRVFAKDLCFDKLLWLFLISGFVGDWIETAFMWITTGQIMSRSSLIYGTFSLVWGLGGAIATGVLYSLKDKNDRYIFLGGFFMGGVYEYSCSVFTEVVLGTKFWDYSHLPFNINGRINLLFCFFWGVLAIVWLKMLYPVVSRFIEKIPPVTGKVLTYVAVLVMVLDMIISGVAITRYVSRKNGRQAGNVIEAYVDKAYSDALVEKIYPNMKITD